MNTVTKITLIFCLTIGLGLHDVSAGGWTQKKKTGYFKIGQLLASADQSYDGNGDLFDINPIKHYQTSLYANYGITDRWTVFTYIPFYVRTNQDIGDTATATGSGFGDMDLGVQYGIIQGKRTVLSVSLLLGIPSGNDSDPNGLTTGDGEFNQMIRVDVGHAFKFGMYVNGSVAFNNRTNGFSEEFRWDFEAGYTAWKRLYLAIKVQGVESFKNGDAIGNPLGLFTNNTEYIIFGPEIGYIHNDAFGVTFTYFSAAKVESAISSNLLSFGIFYKLNANKKQPKTDG